MKEKQALNVELNERYKDKLVIVNKLASHFGLAKAELQDCVDWDEELLHIPHDRLVNAGFDYVIKYAQLDIKKLNLNVLWTDKFFKSSIYEMWQIAEGENGGPDDNFIMTLHLGENNTLVIYRLDDLDDFCGGCLIRLNEDELFAIEPIKNFLKLRFRSET